MTDLRKLQLLQTRIVADIDSICTKNGLKYYLIGGTLLGAVRHRGFIPWDDDVDLVMYREDYNKLMQLIRKDYKEKYFVQTFETDSRYSRYIMKIRLNNTAMVEKCSENSGAHSGIYIDIFPLDHVRKKDGLELRFRGGVLRLLFAYKAIKNGTQSKTSKGRLLLGKILRGLVLPVQDQFINKLFAFVCEKDNKKAECQFTTNFASHFKWKRQLFDNDVYGDGCRLEFEGYSFCAPKKYRVILERLYGEKYMELPPEEKRIAHSIVKLDFGAYADVAEHGVGAAVNESGS